MTTSELISESEQPTPPAVSKRTTPHPLVLRVHFYAGIFVAPFILIAALTGGLYAMSPTIESILNDNLLHVRPTGSSRPVADQVRAAQAIRPGLTLVAVAPAPSDGDTTRVIFSDPALGESERRAVFIDPSTATTVGEATVYGSGGALPFRTWVSELHKNLHLGKAGEIYSELAASWVGIIALFGTYLWVRRYRARRSGWARPLTPDRSSKGRQRTLNWHGAVGMWIVLPLLFLSATGMTWSTYAGAHITELRRALAWTTPAVSASLPGTAAARPAGDHHVPGPPSGSYRPDVTVSQIDSVLATARANGVDGTIEASFPAGPGTAFTVKQLRTAWSLSANSVAVDGATGAATDVLPSSSWPVAAQLTNWAIGLHMGLLFGLANQLVLLAVAGALVTVILRGYLMWWQRRPAHGGSRFGRAPRRGAWRSASPLTVAVLGAAAIAVGWFAPLVGISLLVFLIIDGTVAGYTKVRTKPNAA
jgi:uncharacterized iron-regulated membrane protein